MKCDDKSTDKEVSSFFVNRSFSTASETKRVRRKIMMTIRPVMLGLALADMRNEALEELEVKVRCVVMFYLL